MDNISFYMRLLDKIIKRMDKAMGHLAIEIAKHQGDIEFSWSDDIVGLKTDGYHIIGKLMVTYRHVLGPFANKVAGDAIRDELLRYPEFKVPEELTPRQMALARFETLKRKLEQKNWWHTRGKRSTVSSAGKPAVPYILSRPISSSSIG